MIAPIILDHGVSRCFGTRLAPMPLLETRWLLSPRIGSRNGGRLRLVFFPALWTEKFFYCLDNGTRFYNQTKIDHFLRDRNWEHCSGCLSHFNLPFRPSIENGRNNTNNIQLASHHQAARSGAGTL